MYCSNTFLCTRYASAIEYFTTLASRLVLTNETKIIIAIQSRTFTEQFPLPEWQTSRDNNKDDI